MRVRRLQFSITGISLVRKLRHAFVSLNAAVIVIVRLDTRVTTKNVLISALMSSVMLDLIVSKVLVFQTYKLLAHQSICALPYFVLLRRDALMESVFLSMLTCLEFDYFSFLFSYVSSFNKKINYFNN